MNCHPPHHPYGRPNPDLWHSRHNDCTRETDFESLAEAMFVRTAHSGHGPKCLQSLSAVSYLGGFADDYE